MDNSSLIAGIPVAISNEFSLTVLLYSGVHHLVHSNVIVDQFPIGYLIISTVCPFSKHVFYHLNPDSEVRGLVHQRSSSCYQNQDAERSRRVLRRSCASYCEDPRRPPKQKDLGTRAELLGSDLLPSHSITRKRSDEAFGTFWKCTTDDG